MIVRSLAIAAAALITFSVPTAAVAQDNPQRTVTADGAVAAMMPCADAADASRGAKGFDALICAEGTMIYIVGSASGETSPTQGPFASNFDELVDDVTGDSDTIDFNNTMVDGRRQITATLGPDPDFGLMKAVETSATSVVYALVMRDPNGDEAPTAEEQANAAMFIDSMEVLD